MENFNEYWEQALTILENQLSNIAFTTWIKPLVPVSRSGDVFILRSNLSFVKEIVEKKHLGDIQNALSFLNGNKPVTVKIITGEDKTDVILPPTPEEKPTFSEKNLNFRMPNGLMPRYTFDNFIVGGNNSMAHAAAVAVSQNPGSSYNPLFLYGGVGLGKTHLMHAIGNEVYKHNPEAKILYVSCETFTNELILAIQKHENETFRQKYRGIDLLLLDDIQFISSKQGTQEEFFFTFNDLWQNGKQIVITSDRHPSAIQNLTDRLMSRLAGGLPIDIGYPNLETRVAILQAKAESQGIMVESDVLKYIADSVKSNIREMEGALTTVIAYAKLANKANDIITMELALNALKDTLGSSKPEINVEYIQNVVANYYNFTTDDLCSKKKTKDLALARQIAMYFSRKLLNNETLVSIGKKFGGKDHSTVMHAIELVGKKMEDNNDFEMEITDIEKIITGK
jgi:chromosomal replication initiator protein